MLERLLIAAVVMAAAALVYGAWRAYGRGRLSAAAEQAAPAEVRRLVDGRRPAVLFFSTADCAQCRLQQGPILSQLSGRVDVAVHKLDAIEQEALARFYGIMTVPTTVVLDAELRPLAVNHGVAPLPKLLAQVTGAGA
jgi:thioredoxin 1